MKAKNSAIVGATIALMVSVSVLSLMWYGVSGVLRLRNLDLTVVFWPSSLMLTTGWRSSFPGITITISSIAVNCLLYAGIAVAIDTLVRAIARSSRMGSLGANS